VPQPSLEGLRLDGKRCLVTGATSGHGLAVARWLARLGGEVVLLGRSEERCQAAAREIGAETGRTPAVLLCDLSSRESIDQAAAEWLARELPLHVLCNNAGQVNLRRRTSRDGIELTLAVNYLACFQLTLRLLPRLCRSATDTEPARVVNVSSDTHRIVSLDPDDLERRGRRHSLIGSYARSKLCIVHFTRELSRRLSGRGVAVNAVDPGPVESRIGQNNPGPAADLLAVVMRHTFPAADWAARTAVWLAAAPEARPVTGGYFKYGRARPPSVEPGVGPRLWAVSAAITGANVAI
jgi:NAD(P)-dependent dehydrogenase (short-subunit alcohol dehydrogenase family)